jgi:hypothetical protein
MRKPPEFDAMVTEFARKSDGATLHYVEVPFAKALRSSAYVDKAELQAFHDTNVFDYHKEAE